MASMLLPNTMSRARAPTKALLTSSTITDFIERMDNHIQVLNNLDIASLLAYEPLDEAQNDIAQLREKSGNMKQPILTVHNLRSHLEEDHLDQQEREFLERTLKVAEQRLLQPVPVLPFRLLRTEIWQKRQELETTKHLVERLQVPPTYQEAIATDPPTYEEAEVLSVSSSY